MPLVSSVHWFQYNIVVPSTYWVVLTRWFWWNQVLDEEDMDDDMNEEKRGLSSIARNGYFQKRIGDDDLEQLMSEVSATDEWITPSVARVENANWALDLESSYNNGIMTNARESRLQLISILVSSIIVSPVLMQWIWLNTIHNQLNYHINWVLLGGFRPTTNLFDYR